MGVLTSQQAQTEPNVVKDRMDELNLHGLRRRHQGKPRDIRFGNSFLDMTPETEAAR